MENLYSHILNVYNLSALEEENERFHDKKEGKIRNRLLEEISGKALEYENHVQKYEFKRFKKELRQRGIELVPVKRKAVVSLWDKVFDSLVPKKKKKLSKLYSNQFRWHLFSFELLAAKTGEAANMMFDLQKKRTLYCFHDCSDEAYKIKNAHLLTAHDVRVFTEYCDFNKQDIYLFSPKGKWTYVRTHEEDCGPYFFSAAEE